MVAMPGPLLLDGGDAINRGLLRFMPLNDGAGSRLIDLSPRRLQGATVGTITRVSTLRGKSTRFPTSSDYGLVSSTKVVSGLANWSIAFWFQVASGFSTVSSGVFYSERASSGNDIVGVYGFNPNLGRANVVYIVMRDDAGTLSNGGCTTTTTSNDGAWHFVVATKANTALSIYLDGRLEGTATWGGTDTFTEAVDSRLAKDANALSEAGTGNYSGLRLFNRALTPPEVARLYRDPWAGTLRTRRRVLATTGTQYTATPGAGAETYAGQGATVKAGATLLPGAGAETYSGKQAAVTAGATVAVGAGTETYQGLGAGVTQPATVAVGAGLVEVLGLQAALGSGLSGRVVRRGRYRTWDDVPTELAPVVSLAENYADELAVQRAVDDALARFAAMKAKTSIARRERLVDDLKRAIVAAVEEAAEADDEDALIALL